jgi:UDPglucose--hexose-1-phosphate uridylyltransferase
MTDFSPELRKDPITGRWVIISSARAKRPEAPEPRREEETPEARERCPFCYGKEDQTPPEIFTIRNNGEPANTPGWLTRVVPNKFPAFGIFPEINLRRIGMFQMATGYGAHEVAIESPEHDVYFEHQPLSQVARIVDTWWERHVDLERDRKLKYVLLFKNHGKAAGASLTHPHAQIIATTVIPDVLKSKLANAKEHFVNGEGCIWCRQIEQLFYYENKIYNPDGSVLVAIQQRDRMVAENEKFVAYIPFAARMPYEIHILPKAHQYSFIQTSPEERLELAKMLKIVLMKIYKLLGNPPYNFYIHSAPNLNITPRTGDYGTIREDFHWHIEILVRTTIWAGFEQGSGIYINPLNPTDAARYLAETEIDELGENRDA